VLRDCLSAGLDLLKIGRGCCFRFAVAAPNVVGVRVAAVKDAAARAFGTDKC
jgi:hypothetical protein